MSAVTIRDLPPASIALALRPSRDLAGIALDELDALRDVDLVAPPELASGAETLVALFRAPPSSGDHLRLPPPSALDGAAMRAALRRVLAIEATKNAPAANAAHREERLLRALASIQDAMQRIRDQSKVTI